MDPHRLAAGRAAWLTVKYQACERRQRNALFLRRFLLGPLLRVLRDFTFNVFLTGFRTTNLDFLGFLLLSLFWQHLCVPKTQIRTY